MSKLPEKLLRRQAKEVKLFRLLTKIIGCSILAISSALMVTYAASALYESPGSYTVSVAKRDMVNNSICLSENPDFPVEMSRLTCGSATEITNIKGEEIPADVDSINGQHNGQNYLAYTYYVKNNGNLSVNYLCTLKISANTNELASAVRVKLYEDGVPTTYARVNAQTGLPEPDTVAFFSENTILEKEVDAFDPGDIHKYTVVVWIEGEDPDTVNERLGGVFKMDMEMSILHPGE